MKIVGGSFGIGGSAWLDFKAQRLVLRGARQAAYGPGDIRSMNARLEKERKFAVLTCLVGAVLLSGLLMLVVGPLGIVGGVALAVVGSFYTKKRHLVDLEFADGASVCLQVAAYDVDLLARFRG